MAQAAAMLDERGERERADELARRSREIRGSLAAYFRRRVSDASEVDDMVQEVFLRIVQRGGVQDVEHFGGYAFQTAATVLADRQRRRTVRHATHHVTFDPELHGEADFDAARITEARRALSAATAALSTLPERTRTIFVLRRLEGLRIQAIAARLGLSVSTVEKHLHRAVEHLIRHAEDLR